MGYIIAPLTRDIPAVAALSDLIIETVSHGGSVSFMHPLAPEVASTFWDKALGK